MKSELKTGVKVGDVMTRDFISVSPETNLRDCAKKMVKQRLGCLIVQEDRKLKGILSRREILWAIFKKSKKDLKDIEAKSVMKRKVVTIRPSRDIIEAMKMFRKKKVRRLPVIESKKVIGIITLKDILKMDPGLFQMIYEIIRIKEESRKIKHRDINCKFRHGICDECGHHEVLCKEGREWICDTCYENR